MESVYEALNPIYTVVNPIKTKYNEAIMFQGIGVGDKMPKFSQFVKMELPSQTIEKVTMHYSQDLMIIRASEFVVIPEHYNEDYHICLIPLMPPPLTINRRDYSFTRKTAIVLPPDVLLSCKNQGTTQADYFQLTLAKERFNEILNSISPQARIDKSLNFPYSPALFSYAQSIFAELELKYPGYELMAQSKLTEFIIQLIRESHLNRQPEKSMGQNYNYVEQAKEYIHHYYNADITLDDLCKELALSRYHFIRIFKAQTGTTPHAYLLDVRLQKALQHLDNNDYSLDEIATRCGFVNRTHFAQCFKRKYGVTPLQYRNAKP